MRRAHTALTRRDALGQGDSTQQHIKNLDVVLGAESLAVIVDDTEGVWPSHLDNLIQVGDLAYDPLLHMPALTVMLIGSAKQVERYIFFPACAQRFGQEEQGSLLQRQQDEDPDVGQLSVVLGVLRSLHTSVFPDDGSEAGLACPVKFCPQWISLRLNLNR